MFIGQLESDRDIKNAKLIGTRFTFKPLISLEIGLNRTIQWGGKGQDNSISGLLKALAGANSNSASDALAGNSIAGADIKWNISTRSKDKHYTAYGQYIGEDRVANSLVLGDETFLVGASVSGLSTKLGGTWCAYIEATDTSAAWFKGRARNNIIYNHGTYTDGVGTNPLAPNGKTWSAVGISLDRKLNKRTKLNLGLQYISEKETGRSRDNDFGASIGFSYSF